MTQPAQTVARLPPTRLGVLLRVVAFAFLEIAGVMLFAPVLMPIGGYLIAATMSTFAAAALANALALRIWERGQLADIGLQWNRASRRNLAVGLGGGAGGACLVLAPPLMLGLAEWRGTPDTPANWGAVLFVLIVIVFGAVGEEMLFRGYGFQVLLGSFGRFTAILPTSAVFGLAHASNLSFTGIGLVNTIAWGVLLGYAFVVSGDLWLPIGLHLGWNWTLPLFGVNLSGFTMGTTGYVMTWKLGDLWSGGAYGPEAGLLTSAVVALLLVAMRRAPVTRQVPALAPNVAED